MFRSFKTRYFDECCSKTIFVLTMKVTGVQNDAVVHRYFDTLLIFFSVVLCSFVRLSIYPPFIIYSNNTKKWICYNIFCFCVITMPRFFPLLKAWRLLLNQSSLILWAQDWWKSFLLYCSLVCQNTEDLGVLSMTLLNCKKHVRLLWMCINKSTVPFQMGKKVQK